MNFNELMQKMRELDQPVVQAEACGDSMPPMSPPNTNLNETITALKKAIDASDRLLLHAGQPSFKHTVRLVTPRKFSELKLEHCIFLFNICVSMAALTLALTADGKTFTYIVCAIAGLLSAITTFNTMKNDAIRRARQSLSIHQI